MKKNILIVVLTILVVGLIGYIIYEKETVKDNVKPVKEENKKEIKLSKDELNDYLKKVPTALEINLDTKDAYNGSKMTINDIDDGTLYGNVYMNSEATNDRPNNIEEYGTIDRCVTKQSFDKVLKSFYNTSKDIDKFSYISGTVYKKDNYYCNVIGQGSLELKKISKLEKYNIDNNNLYIYETAGFKEEKMGEELSFSIYKNPKYDDVIGVESATVSDSDLLNKYASSFGKYKHTFKKDSTGNYYWVSTELE